MEGWILMISIRDHRGLSSLASNPRKLSATVITSSTARGEGKTTLIGLTLW